MSTDGREDDARARIGVALFVALLAIALTYAGMRAGDVLFGRTEPVGGGIVSGNIALFTRLAAGAYVAGPVFALAYFVARDPARGERLARIVFAVTTALALVQGLFLP